MQISSAIAQLRTTDLAASISFYTTKVGLTLEFRYQDFYAGIRAGSQIFHLKLVDEKDPSIEFVDRGEHFHLYHETDDAAATAEASDLTRFCRLMRPVSCTMTRAKKSPSVVSVIATFGAAPGASATSTPRRLRVSS